MPARLATVCLEYIHQAASHVCVSGAVVETVISGYPASPTIPGSGISFTSAVVETIYQAADPGKGARFCMAVLETIQNGECAAGGGTYSSGNPLAPTWVGFTFAPATKGTAYSQVFDLTPAQAPTTYSVVSGSLPPGLTLSNVSGDTGQITGTPTSAGSYSFTLRALNGIGSADKSFSLTVNVNAAGGGSYVYIS